ncbi:MAG: RNA polymerase subunit sigma-24 [Brevundimonas sp.]|uniref:RNA polymerase sigma factor n=1 Tax=Brevundimonas sp. TaxID=1871086 RepID=UPI000DB00ED4|nr:sigma-70 family RNA polymerase sigma factor [Brevundimonas sp.]PZT99001.1 MAG: RNA polymerase subunit sigma-24 [Brevundimonas sp.]
MTSLPHSTTRWLAIHALPNEPALRRWLGSRSVAGLDIDDIIQDTYAALARRDDLDQIRNPRAYMFRVAYTLILNEVRRAKVVSIDAYGDLARLEIAGDAPSPEQATVDRDELRNLARFIDELPPQPRRVFTLRRVRGLSQREVAREMGLSENTVEKYMTQALRRLSDHFGRDGKGSSRASNEHGEGTNRLGDGKGEQSGD